MAADNSERRRWPVGSVLHAATISRSPSTDAILLCKPSDSSKLLPIRRPTSPCVFSVPENSIHPSIYPTADCMGDLQSWPPKRNGTLIDASLSPSPSPPRSNPHPSSIGDDIWRRAENAAGDIVRRFQPTMASERKRNAVIEHLQWLIKAYVGGEKRTMCAAFVELLLPQFTKMGEQDVSGASSSALMMLYENQC
ncbi:hypothetical protein ACLOJK_012186 [Asimina triloba]